LFDWLAGTLPWGLLTGLFLGIVVAFRNVIRCANRSSDERTRDGNAPNSGPQD